MKHGNLRQRAAVIGLAALALVGAAACEPTPAGTGGGDGTGTTWKLVGGDEFSGTSLNRSIWSPYNNTYGDGNHELACLQPSNIAVSGGTMKIASRKETVTCPGGKVRNYTSAFIGSRETGTYYPRYARFEIRAKLPHTQGFWPAFWLRHRDGAGVAEVDILEYFHSQVPGKSTGTLHLDGRHNLSKKSTFFESSTAPSGWHTWAVDISPDPSGVRFEFLLDGVAYHSYVDTQHRWASGAEAGTWDIAVNQAVGGDWTGDPDGSLGVLPLVSRCAQGGTYPAACKTTGINRVNWSNPATSTFEVDYVRVWTKN